MEMYSLTFWKHSLLFWKPEIKVSAEPGPSEGVRKEPFSAPPRSYSSQQSLDSWACGDTALPLSSQGHPLSLQSVCLPWVQTSPFHRTPVIWD